MVGLYEFIWFKFIVCWWLCRNGEWCYFGMVVVGFIEVGIVRIVLFEYWYYEEYEYEIFGRSFYYVINFWSLIVVV